MSFSAVQWALAQEGLKPATKLVLITLCSYANARGQAWPSRELIRRKSGVDSVNTVDAHLKVLVETGYILKQNRHGAGERTTSLLYTVNIDFELLDRHLQRNRRTLRPDIEPEPEGGVQNLGGSSTPKFGGGPPQNLDTLATPNFGEEASIMNTPPFNGPVAAAAPGKGGGFVSGSLKGQPSDPELEERVLRFLTDYPPDPPYRHATEQAFRKLSTADQTEALRWIASYKADSAAKKWKLKTPVMYLRERVFEGYAKGTRQPPSYNAAKTGTPDAPAAAGEVGFYRIRKGSPEAAEWERYHAATRTGPKLHAGLSYRYMQELGEEGRMERTRWPPDYKGAAA